ncbi:MAG: DNA mismatch repair endonuclease MutL [Gemmataceae bacterium]|nr:DNA mismatch repair endonuclease MutL [Gemmataceae bacterium]
MNAVAESTCSPRRIRQLSSLVVSKIAAGEVIERPASVLKELLENSLDAGARRIEIDVEQGGVELIRVVDDGHGIHADDLELAFSNHATSKLLSADDLFQVNTMGFRGEALASIGGVAQVTLQSRPSEGDVGAEIACRGGELSPVRIWNGSSGTRTEVRHLFFNTPVRRKFLKTPTTEIGHICEVFTRIALANPGLHLVLRHNGKMVYEVPGGADLLERIGLFFGDDIRDKIYAIDDRHGPAHLYGFIADPSCDRGTAKMQYLFLNGRWIRDRALGHAVQEGYRGLLMTGRYAVAFLFLDLPADAVDVNVHPTKSEVRFREGQSLFSFFLATIRHRLSRENLTARLQAPRPGSVPVGFMSATPTSESGPSLFGQPGFPTFVKRPLPDPPARPPQPAEVPPEPFRAPPESAIDIPSTVADVPYSPPAMESASVMDPGSRAIQVHNAYLIVETAEGMLVIDQHALHERVLFEKFKEKFQQGSLESQRLLIPEPIELPPDQSAKVLEHREALCDLGLGVEDFGGGTLLVNRYPAILGRTAPADILKSVVDYLLTQDRPPPREVMLGELMSLMACHAAVRSGDPLTAEEITDLAAMRHLATDAHHCPHGRPTALLFTRHELDKQFRRI